MRDSNVKWAISLSDGTNAYEDKNEYKEVEGDLSPYQKLLNYIEENDVEMTSMSLYTDEGRAWNLPSAGDNPKFDRFENTDKPVDFKFRRHLRQVGMMGGSSKTYKYAMIEAEYEDYKLQVWVMDKEPYPSWTLVIDKDE